jgi:polysaccharide chain length determinant protein (PEP-CTERM system associated)
MQSQYQAQPQSEGTFTFEDVVLVVRRRLWWLIVPTVVGTLLGIVVALVWPPTYEASTDVLILAQAISEGVVESSIGSDTEARFDQIRRQILARDALSQIVADFEIYKSENVPLESKLERLRGNIAIEPLTSDLADPRRPQINSFRISFQSPDRKIVAGVANRLREAIIDTNLENRRKAAEGSSDFIASEIERREKQLRGLTGEIATFRAQNAGRLPDELPDYRRTLDRLTQQLEITRTRLSALEQQMARARQTIADTQAGSVEDTSNPAVRKRTIEIGITRLLAEGKTEKHPDLKIARAELAEIEKTLSQATTGPRSPEEARIFREISGYEAEIATLKQLIEQKETEAADLEGRIAEAGKLTITFQALASTYQTLTGEIAEIQKKRTMTDLGTSLEVQEKGERFRVIEVATEPSEPVSPNRPLLFVVGMLFGIMAGLGLMTIRHLSDASIYTVQQLRDAIDVPVLGVIPVILGEDAEPRRGWRPWPLSRAAALVVALVPFAARWLGGGRV